MTRIEDRLSAAADDVRRRGGADLDVSAALDAVTGERARTRRPYLLAAAALLAVALLAGAGWSFVDRDEQQVVADGNAPGPGATVEPSAARSHVLEQLRMVKGSVRFDWGVQFGSLADLLPNVEYEHPDGRRTTLSDLVVLGRVGAVEPGAGFVVPDEEANPNGEPTSFEDPDALWRTIRVHVEVERSIGGPEAPEDVVVELPYHDPPDELDTWESGLRALGRTVFVLRSTTTRTPGPGPVHRIIGVDEMIATVGADGALVLPVLHDDRESQLLESTPDLASLIAAGERPPRVVRVDERGVRIDDPDGGSTTTVPGPQAPDGPDLADPEPGREITFDRIGEVALGQSVPTSEANLAEFHPCGYWPAGRSADEFDDPGQTPTGLVDASSGTPVLSAVYIRENPTYRTASGVGVGTSLATLERVYGDELVIDHPDPDFTPTDGLIAYYQNVAGVQYGDHALAFYLRDDVVEAVKLSGVDFWGDDEGCA